MRKPPIKNYEAKMEWMILNQIFQCSGCGIVFSQMRKINPQFAHYLARTDDNLKKYPLMIDSILNASAQCPACNINHITQYGKEPMTNLEAQIIETYLQNNPDVEKWVNYPDSINYNLKETMKEIFGGC